MPETSGNDGGHGRPEWCGPPEMIGGYVAGPILIGRADRVVVAALQVLAFPAGVQVEVEAHARGSWDAGAATAPEDLRRGSDLRFRLRFSDGREAAQDDEAGLRSGRGPMLIVGGSSESSYGGPDSREDARLTLWAWPLPPSGPVRLTCSWPRHGLRDASVLLDGDAIQAAARQAEPFWPVPGP